MQPRPDSGAETFLVVGIGASAGGLEAMTKLVDALPPDCDMAFVLVQHLDPSHASMMVELLATHTRLPVVQAAQGMKLQPAHIHVIPPGVGLTVDNGLLRLAGRKTRHGVRLPFDALLRSIASYGPRAACVVLSGTGADGSAGLRQVHEAGGLVLAQTPAEAGQAGMPESAIATGLVDRVLDAADIPAALLDRETHAPQPPSEPVPPAPADTTGPAGLDAIIDLLRRQTVYDFRLYKPGTLQRRVERRIAMAAVPPGDMSGYLSVLQTDETERDLLARDLLIHVTSFFRDPKVFELLARSVIPTLVRDHAFDRPLRVWVPGCSTGEETYSLAMLFLEAIADAKRSIKLQIFASDIDAEAVSTARDGLYPESLSDTLSPERLRRFFFRDDRGWRVQPDVRAVVVFTVQDVLADPPFSRLDFISCRNLLIYLRADAQDRILSLFHFALREGGVLLLGSAESTGDNDSGFETLFKNERVFRNAGRRRAEPPGPSAVARDGLRLRPSLGQPRPPSRQAVIAELGRRLVLEAHAPASVLVNERDECLFSLGPTDRYLRLAPGQPSHDLVALARPSLRTRLRSAIGQARQNNTRVVIAGRVTEADSNGTVDIEVQPILEGGEHLMLICFVDTTRPETLTHPSPPPAAAGQRIAELERDLEATRSELQAAVRDLEASSEDQRAINEEALSVNEEYQSTNEELLASKEELQSLNEELSALNSQLQETLERQRTTSDDLQNVLYSTNVATLFLDPEMRIRFFTPATRALFAILPADVGRPLADLASRSPDTTLAAEAVQVLERSTPASREVETSEGLWFRRHISPYRAHDDRVEGVVITFTDITARRNAASALEQAKVEADDAKQQADTANVAKSRFLASASHDLRQPLQTLALLQGLLQRSVKDAEAQPFVARLAGTVNAMSSILDTLLDINQIEAGVVRPAISRFSIGTMLRRLGSEFADDAWARSLTLRVEPCSVEVFTDPDLLRQMLRNLLSNALKYTDRGRVLLGCRRRGAMLRVEIWDTGIGIPESDLAQIFEEYHQLGNAARERSRGLGLGLSIVQRLAKLLGHRIDVRSRPRRGSMFAIEVPMAEVPRIESDAADPAPPDSTAITPCRILVVEDDPDIRDLMRLLLQAEGHIVSTAPDGPAALALMEGGEPAPDLLCVDYNLPRGIDGFELATRLRARLGRTLPMISLTGDITSGQPGDAAPPNCVQLYKPVRQAELIAAVHSLMASVPVAPADAAPVLPAPAISASVFIIDDDDSVRAAIRSVLEEDGHLVADFATAESFLVAERVDDDGCLLVDAILPGLGGVALIERIRASGSLIPAIMITGRGEVAMAVAAMKAGAVDFIEKPIGRDELLAAVHRALTQSRDTGKRTAWRQAAARHLASLTTRQREVMTMVLAGHPSKNIAADLGISQRTVENHRAAIMKKTGADSLPALARLALSAEGNADPANAEAGGAE